MSVTGETNTLKARRLGLDTQHETMVFVRKDSPVCRSEGFSAHSRVQLSNDGRSIIATLYFISPELLGEDEVGLSESAWRRLGVEPSTVLTISHPRPLDSLGDVRAKIFGQRFDETATMKIVTDIVEGHYSDIHLASFITACSARSLDLSETIALTRAMVDTGEHLAWSHSPIVDKHCVGGLPGNRTTPIVVSIIAAHGLTMPKTSSRAITSPSGTANTMETLTCVNLTLDQMRDVIAQEYGCFVWGGSVRFSPSDDAMIRIERALDLDSEGIMIASVLSKKIAAGSSHLIIDIPVGPTAKVRSHEAAQSLRKNFETIARQFGITVKVEITDGSQPVGRGIGPALEARDVLAVLQNQAEAPGDLRERACQLAGSLLELVGKATPKQGTLMALDTLDSGEAWKKFQAICKAQGGLKTPPIAQHQRPVCAPHAGRITQIDNRRLGKAAKLAGAPADKAAGLYMHVRLGDVVQAGDPLYTLHTESVGELTYVVDYVMANPGIIEISAP
ncbi:MAG: thymidine phosphorylase family protein [Alphaproteobacteria bacterium]|nr:thymidine phosphorylase family protein [Alphaproteobacteria bacterium]